MIQPDVNIHAPTDSAFADLDASVGGDDANDDYEPNKETGTVQKRNLSAMYVSKRRNWTHSNLKTRKVTFKPVTVGNTKAQILVLLR